MLRISFDSIDKIWNQIISTLKLYINVCPSLNKILSR